MSDPRTEGRTAVTTYFLQMHSPPSGDALKAPVGVQVDVAPRFQASEYLALYHAVGEPWLWYERSDLSEREIEELIHADDVTIFLLRQGAETAGFCELKRSANGETQILYFGLLPAFIGQGLGAYFLDWIVQRSFESGTQRLWVHTCSLDHPRALDAYLGAGFATYRQESGWVKIPDSAKAKL